MPNFVKVDSKPYHPETYLGPEQDEEENEKAEKAERDMSIKLKVENTLRWRWIKDESGADVGAKLSFSVLSNVLFCR
jgi:RNA polymerase-associated protein LEO1